jgi:hypothetical protein
MTQEQQKEFKALVELAQNNRQHYAKEYVRLSDGNASIEQVQYAYNCKRACEIKLEAYGEVLDILNMEATNNG